QDEKGSLESVLGVLLVDKQSSADAQHHRTVSPHQGRESKLVAFTEEVLQQLPVGHGVRTVRPHHRTGRRARCTLLTNGHVVELRGRHTPLSSFWYCPGQEEHFQLFSEAHEKGRWRCRKTRRRQRPLDSGALISAGCPAA